MRYRYCQLFKRLDRENEPIQSNGKTGLGLCREHAAPRQALQLVEDSRGSADVGY